MKPVASKNWVMAGAARDCIGRPSLERGRPDEVHFVVWCGVQSGKVKFSIGGHGGPDLVDFDRLLSPTGEGAARSFQCHRESRTVQCAGLTQGPLVLRGSVRVPSGSRCLPMRLHTAESTDVDAPVGCPYVPVARHVYRPHYFHEFRREFGRDADLHGDKAAINRRIRGTVVAWHRGEPVARVTEQELGLPLRPVDMRRLEFESKLVDRAQEALESWVPRHAPDTYAGSILDVENGPVIFRVGFTGDQVAQLEAFEREVKLFAPEHVQPFVVPPTYSEQQLERYREKVVELVLSRGLWLLNSVRVDTEANRVWIGTQHGAKLKRLLLEEFGTLDPFLLEFSEPDNSPDHRG